MDIKTTREYFNKTDDELLEIRDESIAFKKVGFTKEECLLYDEGLEVVYFDDEEDMKAEQEEFNQYIQSKKYEIKATLETINERIAVVLV